MPVPVVVCSSAYCGETEHRSSEDVGTASRGVRARPSQRNALSHLGTRGRVSHASIGWYRHVKVFFLGGNILIKVKNHETTQTKLSWVKGLTGAGVMNVNPHPPFTSRGSLSNTASGVRREHWNARLLS